MADRFDRDRTPCIEPILHHLIELGTTRALFSRADVERPLRRHFGDEAYLQWWIDYGIALMVERRMLRRVHQGYDRLAYVGTDLIGANEAQLEDLLPSIVHILRRDAERRTKKRREQRRQRRVNALAAAAQPALS